MIAEGSVEKNNTPSSLTILGPPEGAGTTGTLSTISSIYTGKTSNNIISGILDVVSHPRRSFRTVLLGGKPLEELHLNMLQLRSLKRSLVISS